MNYVYFVQPEDGGPIKIGITNDLTKRLAGLQTGSPVRLVLRHYIEAGTAAQAYALERSLHSRFCTNRLHGEWFEASPSLAKLARAPVTPTYNYRKHRKPLPPDAQQQMYIDTSMYAGIVDPPGFWEMITEELRDWMGDEEYERLCEGSPS